MTDPEDLLVFVVGIERYEGGDKWNIPGAARDAVEFAKWLIERGLPPQNIHVFLSVLDEEDPGSVPPSGAVVHPAKTRDLYGALYDELHERKPARFCLFWGGHGCVKEGTRERILLGADATYDNLQGINLTQFLWFLETDLVGWGENGDHRDFVIIVDACAGFLRERGYDRRITAQNFPLSNQTQRSQFSLYSAGIGQRAQNRDRERTGAFSKELRARLRDVPNLDGLFHLEEISQQLLDLFDQRKQEGLSEQTPISCEVRAFSGGKRHFGEESLARIDECRPTHAVTWSELAELSTVLAHLAPPIPASTVRELYAASTSLNTSAPGSHADHDCLIECVLELGQRSGGGPLFTFLEYLRGFISDPGVRDTLADWEGRVAARLGADLSGARAKASSPPPVPPAHRVIQIVVVPTFGFNAEDPRYRVHAAVYSARPVAGAPTAAPFDVIHSPSGAVATDKLYVVVDDVFRQALAKIVSQEAASLTTTRVEAILPAELLPLGALEWKAQWGKRREKIDSRYPLALRSYERGYHPDYDGPRLMQRDKWKRARHALAQIEIAWWEHVSELDEVTFDRWDSEDILAFCALSLDGDQQQVAGAIERFITAGIPIGVWFWQPVHPANGWKQAVCQQFVVHPTQHWPQRAQQFQKNSTGQRAPACKGVALLWDNPEQPLLPLPSRDSAPLQAPKTGMDT